MNVQFSYKIAKTSDLEKLINQQVEKLGRYLQVFRPESVTLKGTIGEISARQGVTVTLNLRIPSAQIASEETASSAATAIKAAFDDITEQVKRHKELLRNRRRGAGREPVGVIPFEQTSAAVKPEQISSGDVADYVNVNLPRLKRFIQRELRYREDQQQLASGQISVDDVLGETIAAALGEQGEKPERMKLEAWIHRLAKQAIGALSSDGDEERRIPLERSRGTQNVQGTDEAMLQFHQPDEKLFEENVIPDRTSNNPEELAARREMIDQMETTLRGAGRSEQESFILYTVEGFTVEEIADISNHSVEEVRAAIRKAGEHLQRALPTKDPLTDKLLEYARSA